MKNKLIQLVEKFDPKERRKAIQFLSSPYFNSKKELTELFLVIVEALDSPKKNSTEKNTLLHRLTREKNLSDQKWRLLNSELFKQLEYFVALEALQNKAMILSNQLATYYQGKKHEKLLQSHLKSWQKAMNSNPFRHEEFEEQKYQFELHSYEYNLTKGRTADLHLQEIQYSLDRSYYSKKIKQACFALSHQAVYNVEYDLGIISQIIKHILKCKWHEVPAIGIYFYCYHMLKEPEKQKHFHSFKEKLHQWSSLFPQEELRSLYLLAINYCIKKLNNGDINYGIEGMDLYDEAIRHKALLINNNLSRYTYRNMCRMAIRTGDFNRAEKLSQEYKPFLFRAYKESAYHFNLSMIYYEKGDLGMALDSIQLVDFKDPLFNLAAKTIQLKIYYELNEEDLLDFHLDAMQMYLIRKKVLGYHKENYQNIIRYTRSLLRMYKYSKEKRIQLKSKIESEQHLTEKSWLLEQIN